MRESRFEQEERIFGTAVSSSQVHRMVPSFFCPGSDGIENDFRRVGFVKFFCRAAEMILDDAADFGKNSAAGDRPILVTNRQMKYLANRFAKLCEVVA